MRFDHDNWYVNKMEKPFHRTEIDARRKIARLGLVRKNHYQPQMIKFDVFNDPLWQANIEAEQDSFQLDRYRSLAFQHGHVVYNPRDQE